MTTLRKKSEVGIKDEDRPSTKLTIGGGERRIRAIHPESCLQH
jgi:hypothetical protein